MKTNGNKGITLIALIITVIILLILAGTAISISVNGGDLFSKATTAREEWNASVTEEDTKIKEVLSLLNEISPSPITMTLNGTEVTLTKANFGEHLGKVVTNYTGAPTTVNGITVSNTYRLFWIDWDNKYKDGTGTIYLKADALASGVALQLESIETETDPEGSVMRKQNPLMYGTTTTPPGANHNNMKAVRWMLNTDNWEGLKIPSLSSQTNYVVASPGLEMFVDSYNTHYGLTNGTMDTETRTSSSPKTRLAYRYILTAYNQDGYTGYEVAPLSVNAVSSMYTEYIDNGFFTWTTDYTVQPDNNIGGMYYPAAGTNYWLASPSAMNFGCIQCVSTSHGGMIDEDWYEQTAGYELGICPLVSLKPTVEL